MRLRLALLERPTEPAPVRGQGMTYERFRRIPSVAPMAALRIGHDDTRVGSIVRTWHDGGTLMGEAVVAPGRESEVRRALAVTPAARVEFDHAGGAFDEEWRDQPSRVYRGATITGVAVGVLDPARRDTRVVAVDDTPARQETRHTPTASPTPRLGPVEYVSFGRPISLATERRTPTATRPSWMPAMEYT